MFCPLRPILSPLPLKKINKNKNCSTVLLTQVHILLKRKCTITFLEISGIALQQYHGSQVLVQPLQLNALSISNSKNRFFSLLSRSMPHYDRNFPTLNNLHNLQRARRITTIEKLPWTFYLVGCHCCPALILIMITNKPIYFLCINILQILSNSMAAIFRFTLGWHVILFI